MNTKKGFTLIELIVVLAILAVVSSIAVPISFGSIENTRASSCEADRTNLLSTLRSQSSIHAAATGSALYDSDADALAAAKSAATKCGLTLNDRWQIEGACPSGGVYQLAYDATSGLFAIECSAHGGNSETLAALPERMESFLNAILTNDKLTEALGTLNNGKALDSTAPDDSSNPAVYANRTATVIALAKDAGVDLTGSSWRLVKNNAKSYTIYYTDIDINTCNAGDRINVTKVTITKSGTTTTTTAPIEGTMTLKQNTLLGHTYNVFNNNFVATP